MGVDEVIRQKRQEILRVAARHGASNVRVFGSVARGEATADSDVDFLVDVGPNRSAFFPGGLIEDLKQLLGRNVDIVTEQGLHWFLRERVLKEAVPL